MTFQFNLANLVNLDILEMNEIDDWTTVS